MDSSSRVLPAHCHNTCCTEVRDAVSLERIKPSSRTFNTPSIRAKRGKINYFCFFMMELRVSHRFRFFMAFTTLAIFTFASALDATLLGNALPIIAEATHATSLEAFWMSTSFLLTAVTFQPVTTALSDIFGRKPTLYLCCALFTIGLIIFGTAKSSSVVILGRTIQGIGGGGLEVLSEVILTDITTLKERPLYLGIMSLFWAGAAVAGPPIGGALAEYLSWRWLAWILLPLMGLSLVLIPPFLTLQQDTSSAIQKAKRVDWAGIALFICASTLILFPITAGGQLFPWQSVQVWAPFSVGAACLAAFCWVEYKAVEPMLPFRIFKSATVSAAMFGACLHGIVVWCALYFLPIYFQAVHGRSAVASGIDGFSFGFTATPAAIITALLIEYIRRYLWTIAGGWALGTAGSAAMTVLSVSTNIVSARALLIPSGIGFGMLYPGLAMPIQAGTDVNDVGIATGTLVFSRNLGSTLGIAVSSAIFTNRFASLFENSGLSYTDFGIGNANDALGLVPQLHAYAQAGGPALRALQGIYASSFKSIAIFMAAVSGLGLITTIFIKELAFEDENLGKQRLRAADSELEPGASGQACVEAR